MRTVRGPGSAGTTKLVGVRKRYRLGGPWVLDGVDLELAPGALVRVIGGNGTGKSTLLRLVAGVGRPTRGRVAGRPVTGYVPEQFSSALPFAVLDYLVHLGRVHGLSSTQSRVSGSELLEVLGAAEFARTPLRELSKGTAQKVAVAQALLARPGLLVLDEAWTGLDVASGEVLGEQVDQRLAAGARVLFVDHEPTRLGGRPVTVHRLEQGRLVPVTLAAAGSPAADVPGPAMPAIEVEIELDGLPVTEPDAVQALLALPDGARLDPAADDRLRLLVPAEASDDVLRRALAAGPKVHIHRLTCTDEPDRGVS
jgi:ABC-type Mn2+/Zn2+ transport system ATPase subunit